MTTLANMSKAGLIARVRELAQINEEMASRHSQVLMDDFEEFDKKNREISDGLDRIDRLRAYVFAAGVGGMTIGMIITILVSRL